MTATLRVGSTALLELAPLRHLLVILLNIVKRRMHSTLSSIEMTLKYSTISFGLWKLIILQILVIIKPILLRLHLLLVFQNLLNKVVISLFVSSALLLLLSGTHVYSAAGISRSIMRHKPKARVHLLPTASILLVLNIVFWVGRCSFLTHLRKILLPIIPSRHRLFTLFLISIPKSKV